MRQQRKRITLDVIKHAYRLAKCIYEGELDKKTAQQELTKNVKMNSNSANYYLQAFQRMMEGKCYYKTINKTATEYYLETILTDFGKCSLKAALSSVKQHIKNYEKPKSNEKPRKLPSIKNIYWKISKKYILQCSQTKNEP